MSARQSVERRLQLRTRPGPNGCVEWIGSKAWGYGTMSVNGRQQRVHRVMWEIVNGPIPSGLFVCHKCDNPSCCNPFHLFLGTCADNHADRDRKGRCRARGLPGEKCGLSKLKEHQVIEILSSNEIDQVLADRFNVTRSGIQAIRNGPAWMYLKELAPGRHNRYIPKGSNFEAGKPRCQALVYRRDTYRYSGRGPSGFTMHYTKCQCKRHAVDGTWCFEHADGSYSKCEWAEPFIEYKVTATGEVR